MDAGGCDEEQGVDEPGADRGSLGRRGMGREDCLDGSRRSCIRRPLAVEDKERKQGSPRSLGEAGTPPCRRRESKSTGAKEGYRLCPHGYALEAHRRVSGGGRPSVLAVGTLFSRRPPDGIGRVPWEGRLEDRAIAPGGREKPRRAGGRGREDKAHCRPEVRGCGGVG